jgi:hypothetical protein
MLRALLALLAAGTLVACGPADNNADNASDSAGAANTQSTTAVLLRTEAEENPTVGPSTVTVFVLNPDGSGVTGASVEVTGDMTHAGMVPVISSAQETRAGEYATDSFEFTMAGDWILTTDVTLSDGTTVTDEIELNVSRE